MNISSEPQEIKYKRVGGWLLFFVLTLTIFSPIATIVQYILLPGELTIIGLIVTFSITCFGIYAGVALWKIRSNAIKIAKSYLFVLLGYSILIGLLSFVDASLAGGHESIRLLIYFIIWYSYLTKSKRVAATYRKSYVHLLAEKVEESKPTQWYYKRWFVCLSLFGLSFIIFMLVGYESSMYLLFVTPLVGSIILLWRSQSFRRLAKISITVAVVLINIFVFISAFLPKESPESRIFLPQIELSELKLHKSRERKVLTISQIAKKYGKAVVFIGTYGKEDEEIGSGTGFLITEDGYILTNYHLLEGAHSTIVKLSNGDIYNQVFLAGQDQEKDIAIVKIKGRKFPCVSLGDSNSVEVGDKVVTIGNPWGLRNTVSSGIISAIREVEEGLKDFQLTAPISEGSSGGPLFNLYGEVIGITYSSIDEGQNLNFAIPANDAKLLLKRTKE